MTYNGEMIVSVRRGLLTPSAEEQSTKFGFVPFTERQVEKLTWNGMLYFVMQLLSTHI